VIVGSTENRRIADVDIHPALDMESVFTDNEIEVKGGRLDWIIAALMVKGCRLVSNIELYLPNVHRPE